MQETISFSPKEVSYPPLISTEFTPLVYEQGIRPPEKRQFSEQMIETANHELHHAIIALDYGVLPLSISVIPDEFSLGRTEFAGRIAPDVLTIIAAGGAIDTVFGKAQGYGHKDHAGSDFAHIANIHKGATNLTDIYSDAIAKARESISRMIPNKDVLRTVSSIIADMKEVRGNMLGKIIAIAQKEVAQGKHNQIQEPLKQIEHAYTSAYASYEKEHPSIVTIIGRDIQGNQMVLIRDEKMNEFQTCYVCNGKGGHLPTCSSLTVRGNHTA